MAPPERKKKSMLPVAVIFGIAGIVPLCLGLYVLAERRAFVAAAAESEGEVVAIVLASSKARTGGDDLNSYAPRVRFTTASGQPVEFQASAASSDTGYRVGDRVAVLYLPDAPDNASINSFFHLWIFPTILLGLGGVFTLLGAGLGVLVYKERRSAEVAH